MPRRLELELKREILLLVEFGWYLTETEAETRVLRQSFEV